MKQKSKLLLYIGLVAVVLIGLGFFIAMKSVMGSNRVLENYDRDLKIGDYTIKVNDAIYDDSKGIIEFTLLRTTANTEARPLEMRISQDQNPTALETELYALNDGVEGYAVRVTLLEKNKWEYISIFLLSDQEQVIASSTDKYGNPIEEQKELIENRVYVQVDKKACAKNALINRRTVHEKVKGLIETHDDLVALSSQVKSKEGQYSEQITALNSQLTNYQSELETLEKQSGTIDAVKAEIKKHETKLAEEKTKYDEEVKQINEAITAHQKELDDEDTTEERSKELNEAIKTNTNALTTIKADYEAMVASTTSTLEKHRTEYNQIVATEDRIAVLNPAIEKVKNDIEAVQEAYRNEIVLEESITRTKKRIQEIEAILHRIYNDGLANQHQELPEYKSMTTPIEEINDEEITESINEKDNEAVINPDGIESEEPTKTESKGD